MIQAVADMIALEALGLVASAAGVSASMGAAVAVTRKGGQASPGPVGWEGFLAGGTPGQLWLSDFDGTVDQ